jgi:hypothetical protein
MRSNNNSRGRRPTVAGRPGANAQQNQYNRPMMNNPGLGPGQDQQFMPGNPNNLNQMYRQSHDKQTFAQKIIKNAPHYLIARIFANINVIHDIIMTGGWLDPEARELLKNEIRSLTETLKEPELQQIINDFADAANGPVTTFSHKLMEILQTHIKDITYKLTSFAANIVGEIPGVNIVTNAALAASNAVHVARNVTDMGGELIQNIKDFKQEITTVMDNFNPSVGQQFGQQQMMQYGQQRRSQSAQQQRRPQTGQRRPQTGQRRPPPGQRRPQRRQQFGQAPQMMQQAPQMFQQAPQMFQQAPQMFQQAPQMMQQGPQMMQQAPLQQYGQMVNYVGGDKSNASNNPSMNDAKKHLHHLHHKKNRTLRRIHNSINEFLASNNRTIKAKLKH